MKQNGWAGLVIVLGVALAPRATASPDAVRQYDFDRPEAWAMAYMTAATLFHGLETPERTADSRLRFGVELGSIPTISASDRQVGFNGRKDEDLNKSKVFGRARLWWGLPWDLTLELGYTPPVSINGLRSDRIFAGALARPLWTGEHWRLGMRLFGQYARVSGDITCSAALAQFGADDTLNNPYGCLAPSDDRVKMNHYGAEFSLTRTIGQWGPFASWSYTRIEPEVDVNAEIMSGPDRVLLGTKGELKTGALGVNYQLSNGMRWSFSGLWTPLSVRRQTGFESGDFWSVHFSFQVNSSHFGF